MYKANTYDYTSSMRLASIKRSQRFRCSAKNIFGTTSQDCSVVVRSPFVARDEPFDRKYCYIYVVLSKQYVNL